VRAVIVSGHLVDAPDRPTPRFPESRVGHVTERISEAFDDWRVGPGTTVVTGGARGADIVAAEEAGRRGANVLVCLALPADEFERLSVHLPGTAWSARFRRLLAAAEIRRLPGDPSGSDVFVRANAEIVAAARRYDPRPHALIVWDGESGDGPGGTADLVRRLGYAPGDPRVRIIDPTPPGRPFRGSAR
jgi:hypothetical protein